MEKEQKKKPVAPIYAFGMTWLVYSILFKLSGVGAMILCLLLSIAVSWLVSRLCRGKKKEAPQPEPEKEAPKPQPEKPATDPEVEAVLNQGKASVKRIQELNDEIPDFKVSAQLKQIEILAASIMDQVAQKPDKRKQIRQFLNYYLPTTIKLLEQYVQLQNVGLKGENITVGMQRIEELLDKVIVAFRQQLDSLFERDVVDITADIQVMEQMMASQGLTGREDFKE